MRRSTIMRVGALVAGMAVAAVSAGGCGYTTRSLLPDHLKTIYVENFANEIPITAQTTDRRAYRLYRPNMEYSITKAVEDRFLYDGNLKIAHARDADLILSGALIDYKKEPIRYDSNNNVEESRLRLAVNIALTERKTGTVVWEEKNFAGEANYRTSGSLATSERTAVDEAEADLARRIVERTVEGW